MNEENKDLTYDESQFNECESRVEKIRSVKKKQREFINSILNKEELEDGKANDDRH